MGAWAVLVVAALALAVVTGAVLAQALRWRVLRRAGARIGCSVRRGDLGAPWVGGLARYDGDALRWYRSLGARLAPDATLSRRGLAVRGRRAPHASERRSLTDGLEVLECSSADGALVALALPREAVLGFLAWLEASPPGGHLG